LWDGATTTKAANTLHTFHYVFPTGAVYNTDYTRHVCLSGIKAPLTDTINYTMGLQPYASDSYADIDVNLGPMQLYSLAVHVMFFNATDPYIWGVTTSNYIINTVHNFVHLADENSGINTESFNVTSPLKVWGRHYIVYPFIQSMKVKSFETSNNRLGIQVQYAGYPT
jgi:hypothetical protein